MLPLERCRRVGVALGKLPDWSGAEFKKKSVIRTQLIFFFGNIVFELNLRWILVWSTGVMSHIFNCYNIAWLWPFPVFWLRIKDYPPDFTIFELSVLWFLSRTKLKVHLLTYNMYVSMSHNISTNNLFYWRLLICHFVTFFSHTAVWQGFFTIINFNKWDLFCFIKPLNFAYRISSYSCRGNYSFLNS